MKATEAALLVFLKKSDQFVIPIYQRTYSWGERECRQLWNDIVFAGKRQESGAHFVGSIVYIQDGIYQASTITPILVIDGQQRLTTVMLLLEALARYLEQHESLDVISPEDIRGDFLLNERKKGNDRFKLLLTQSDRETLCALVTQKDLPREPSIRMMANFQLFTDW
ncbi:MAG: DUF262 domain-containing protein, partial [Thaumarchaeota archaeon]|nr:DUF262 domain-containing protein [Nitrososphaerota archaeon]